MGVIPEQSRVGQHEIVSKSTSGLNVELRNAGHAVHVNRDSHTMPMNCGRRGQVVCEVNDQAVADIGANQWARNPSVVSPRLNLLAGDLDVGYNRIQIDLDDAWIGI